MRVAARMARWLVSAACLAAAASAQLPDATSSRCNASTLLDAFSNATYATLSRWSSLDALPDAGFVPFTATRATVIAALARIDYATAAVELSSLLSYARPDGSVPNQIYPSACISAPSACSPPPSTWPTSPNTTAITSSLSCPPILPSVAASIFYSWLNASGDDTSAPVAWLNAVWPALFSAHAATWSSRVASSWGGPDLYSLFTPFESVEPHSPSLSGAVVAARAWDGARCTANATWTVPPPTVAQRSLRDWPGDFIYASTWCVTLCVVATGGGARCGFEVVSIGDQVKFIAASRALADLGRWVSTGGAPASVAQAESWTGRAAAALGAIATAPVADDDDLNPAPLFSDLNLTAYMACGNLNCARLPHATLTATLAPLLLSESDTATWSLPTWRGTILNDILSPSFAPPLAPTLSRTDADFNASNGWFGSILLPVAADAVTALTATGDAGATLADAIVATVVRGMCATGGDSVVLDSDTGRAVATGGTTLYSVAGAPTGVLLLTVAGSAVPPPVAPVSRAGLITAMTIELLFLLSAATLCVFLGARTLATVHAEAAPVAVQPHVDEDDLEPAELGEGLKLSSVNVAGSINVEPRPASTPRHALAAVMQSTTPRASFARPATPRSDDAIGAPVAQAAHDGDGEAVAEAGSGFPGVATLKALWGYLVGSSDGGDEPPAHGYSAFRDYG